MSAAAAPAIRRRVTPPVEDRTHWPGWTQTPRAITKSEKFEIPAALLYPSLTSRLTYTAFLVLQRLICESSRSGYMWVNTTEPQLAKELGRSKDMVNEAILELKSEQLVETKHGGPRGTVLYRVLEANLPTEEFPPKKAMATETSAGGDDDNEDELPPAAETKTDSARSNRFYPRTHYFKNGSGVKKARLSMWVEDHEFEIINGPKVPIPAGIEFDEKKKLFRTTVDLAPVTALIQKMGEETEKSSRSGVRTENGSIHNAGVNGTGPRSKAVITFLATATRCGVRGSDVQTDKALELLASYPIADQIAAERGIRERFDAGQYPRFAPGIYKYVSEREWTNVVRPAKRAPAPNGRKTYETAAERKERAQEESARWAREMDAKLGRG